MHRSWVLLAALSLWLLVSTGNAYKHNLKINHDHRSQFFIENFGFASGGEMIMNISGFQINGDLTAEEKESIPTSIYFLIRITTIDSTEFLEEKVDYTCDGGQIGEDFGVIIWSEDWSSKSDFSSFRSITSDNVGLYNLYFINCLSHKVGVSFHLYLDQYNVIHGEMDYLPIGLSPIPTIYVSFSLAYIVLFIIWIFNYIRKEGAKIYLVHHLMSILVVLKFLSLLFYGIEQHFVKRDGVPGGWEVAYYIFAVLKTLFFFVILTLIGTGWSFFKPFLSDKDKKVILVVIPLQILANIAMIIVGSTAPGSVGWFTWNDIFRLVDIICCGAILIPIIWSIKHLQEASQIDGKAARNLEKLKLFRSFYLVVVCYIYFTRIIIYLLDATLQYYLIWLGQVFTELATFIFFVVVGKKFMPTRDNPYLKLEEEDAIRLEEMRKGEEESP